MRLRVGSCRQRDKVGLGWSYGSLQTEIRVLKSIRGVEQ